MAGVNGANASAGWRQGGGTEFGLVFTSAQRVLFSLYIQLNMSGNKPGTTLVLVDGL